MHFYKNYIAVPGLSNVDSKLQNSFQFPVARPREKVDIRLRLHSSHGLNLPLSGGGLLIPFMLLNFFTVEGSIR